MSLHEEMREWHKEEGLDARRILISLASKYRTLDEVGHETIDIKVVVEDLEHLKSKLVD